MIQVLLKFSSSVFMLFLALSSYGQNLDSIKYLSVISNDFSDIVNFKNGQKVSLWINEKEKKRGSLILISDSSILINSDTIKLSEITAIKLPKKTDLRQA